MWDYVYFAAYIEHKTRNNMKLSFNENRLNNLIKKSSFAWLPINKSLSLRKNFFIFLCLPFLENLEK